METQGHARYTTENLNKGVHIPPQTLWHHPSHQVKSWQRVDGPRPRLQVEGRSHPLARPGVRFLSAPAALCSASQPLSSEMETTVAYICRALSQQNLQRSLLCIFFLIGSGIRTNPWKKPSTVLKKAGSRYSHRCPGGRVEISSYTSYTLHSPPLSPVHTLR